MGLTSWSGQKRGLNPIKKDVSIAKNYLSEDEIKELSLLTTMLLDYTEAQVKRGKVFKMSDWDTKVSDFLEFNGYDVLKDFGKIKAKTAKIKAENEYNKFKELKQNSEYKDKLKKDISSKFDTSN